MSDLPRRGGRADEAQTHTEPGVDRAGEAQTHTELEANTGKAMERSGKCPGAWWRCW